MSLLRSRLAFSMVFTGAVAACAAEAGSGTGEASDLVRASTVECPADMKKCGLTITYPDHGETSVELRGDFGGPDTWKVGRKMTRSGGLWRADITAQPGQDVQYKFVADGEWRFDEARPTVTVEGNTNNVLSAAASCEKNVCEEAGPTPAGVFDWRDSVIYFVFVDRFANGKPHLDQACRVPGVSGDIVDYQGGDWAGVTQKINENYFNQMGVNTLWITVPFENAATAGKGIGGDEHLYSASHGYWPKLDSQDPNQLDHESCFGSMDDLKDLVSSAHAKGLKVLFDFAMVHVHSSSALYQAHQDWFWPNSKDGSPDCICGQSCSWDGDGQRCWFTDYLPHWNYTNPEARAWSVANAVAWVKQTGVDGFRADAIKHVDISWLNALREGIDREIIANQETKQRFYMVGETYDFGNRDLLKSYVDAKTKLDGQFDFPLRARIVDATLLRSMNMSDLAAFMDSNDYFYGSDAVMSTFIGNHDLPRVIHASANQPIWNQQWMDGKDRAWQNQPGVQPEREAYERMANGFAVLFTNRGAPLVYYGDEIGLPGAGDPDNRRPMQWSGLSANQTYLKERLAKLGQIRAEHPALRRGIRSTLSATADTWAFVREADGDKVFVAINRSDSAKDVTGLPEGAMTELLTGEAAEGTTQRIPPRQTRIFVAR